MCYHCLPLFCVSFLPSKVKKASSNDSERLIEPRVHLQDRAEASGVRASEHTEGGEMLKTA